MAQGEQTGTVVEARSALTMASLWRTDILCLQSTAALQLSSSGTANVTVSYVFECAAPHHATAMKVVVQAEGQCRAGLLLGGLGLDISLPGIRASTPAAAKDVLMVLLAKLSDSVPPLSEARSVLTFVFVSKHAGLPLKLCWIVA